MAIPKISVLMTSFNREKYISQSIESALSSTFKDFELIIVDDCSTDSTVEIARKFETLDSRVKVYVNEKNLGDYPNRNRAASYARGKYIKYLDSDDIIYPNGLTVMYDSMEKHDGMLGLCCGNYQIKPLPVFLNPRESFMQHFFGGGLFGRSPLSAIINLDFFNSIGGFKQERMVSDYEFFFRVGLEYGILCIQDGLSWNRIHDGQEVRDVRKFKKRYSEIESNFINHLKSPLSIKEKKKIYLKKKREYLFHVIKSIIR
jgi:glycosyltransferase involved in cell wall biosynthesis